MGNRKRPKSVGPPSPPRTDDAVPTGSCRALDRTGGPCRTPAEPGSQWCAHHEVLEGKCMRIYKSHSRELDGFCAEATFVGWKGMTGKTPTAEDVMGVEDVEALRGWHAVGRRAWLLTNRQARSLIVVRVTVAAREHHHRQFYRDGDSTHRHFILVLRNRLCALDALMLAIDDRIYHLTISAEQKNWSEGEDVDDQGEVECHEEPPPVATPPPSPTLRPIPDCEDHQALSTDEVMKRKRTTVQTSLLWYLDLPDVIEDPDFRRERRQIMLSVIRLTISRDVGLLVRAREVSPRPDEDATPSSQTDDDEDEGGEAVVRSFITSDSVLSLRELDRLWRSLKFGKHKLGPDSIRNAIALLDSNEDVGCSGCMSLTCRTFTELSTTRKLSILGHPKPRYPGWVDCPDPTDAPERTFALFGIVVCRDNRMVKTVKVEKTVPKAKGLKVVYSESQQRHFVHLRMPATEESRVVIDALSTHVDDFALLASRPDFPPPESLTHRPRTDNELWSTRVRSGYSATDRRSRPFTVSSTYDPHLLFDRLRLDERRFPDVWDVVAMDSRGDGFGRFLQRIAGSVLETKGYATVEEAVDSETGRSGEGEGRRKGEDGRALKAFRVVFREPLPDGEALY